MKSALSCVVSHHNPVPLVVLLVLAYAGGLLLGSRLGQSPVTVLAWVCVAAAAALAYHWTSPGHGVRLARGARAMAMTAVAVAGAVAGWSAAAAPPVVGRHRPEVPALLAPLRTASIRAIERDFGADASLAKALLIADRSELPLEIRDRFSTAGLAHVLSISGLHVGIAAASIEIFARSVGVAAQRARVATIVVLGTYVLMLGAPPPALRAAAMFAAVAATRWRGRPTSPWAALAVGAALPLLADPRAVTSIGWQLSAGGVASLIAARMASSRTIGHRVQGWRRGLLDAALASTIASFASAPIVAWHFGRVSLVGPVSNMVAAPVVAVMQPTLFLALLLSPIPPLSSFVATAAHPLLTALDTIAGRAAGLPGASVYVAPTALGATLATALVIAVLAVAAARERTRPTLVAAALLAVLAWLPLKSAGNGLTELHVIDVGQGDAVAIRTARGRWVLVDAGRSWRGGDAGRAAVIPHIRRRGGSLVAFVVSHPHTDHVGGAETVLRGLRPPLFYDAGFAGPAESYRRALRSVMEGTRTVWRRVRPGDSLRVDEVTLHFLAPDSAWAAGLKDPNDASTVVLARSGGVRFLLTGDAEMAEEEWLLEHSSDEIRADVLKVGHHGSRTSSHPRFVAAVSPRLAIISVGAINGYGHPDPETLATFEDQGAEVLRTDRDGTVIISTDGRRLFAEVDGLRSEVVR
jgi:competence protein ComEC